MRNAHGPQVPLSRGSGGSINRSVCRVMVGVAGLTVLGMTATLAGAQTDEAKEKPPLYRYESYWTFPRAHWSDVTKDNATGNQKVLAPALADGTLVELSRVARPPVLDFDEDPICRASEYWGIHVVAEIRVEIYHNR